MKVSDFNFHLPEELIAQHRLENREDSKLLVIDKLTGKLKDDHFYNILNYLDDGDVLVLNETKVIPARLYGIKEDTNAKVEVLLLKEIKTNTWEALVKPARRVKIGSVINFNNLLNAKCVKELEEGIRVFELQYDGILYEVLDKIGAMPLPPYIKETLKNNEDYQTVYAKNEGSVAAPTAGLHFTNKILDNLKNKNIEIIKIDLVVGLGTFRPVSASLVENHNMHSEKYTISTNSSEFLNRAVLKGKKIVCVGTTSLRALESNYDGKFTPGTFDTNIFIYPGYKFKIVDSIITNFHLPKSTLFMLVSAFTSLDIMQSAYQHAIDFKYRFFSFGDSMLIKEGILWN